MMTVIYTLGILAYLWCGYVFLALDAFSGTLTRKYSPIVVFLGWPIFIGWWVLESIWENWFKIRK